MKKVLLSLLMVVTAVLGDLGIALAFDAGVEDSVVVCSNQDKRRIVTLDYEKGGMRLPCQVIYEKPTELPGFSKKMWYAEHTEGYCEKKMDEFLDKLEGWGWECSKRGQDMTWGIPERPRHQWYVILGSFPQTQDGLKQAFALREQFRSDSWNQDDFIVGESDFYAGLKKGVHVMKGPFPNEQEAQDWANTEAVREIVPDAAVQKATAQTPEYDSADGSTEDDFVED